jgi:hypothetical protein
MTQQQEQALKKAIACEAHARAAPDELLRAKFRKLRDSWLRIANASQVTIGDAVEPNKAG